jgi:hypothetical protein
MPSVSGLTWPWIALMATIPPLAGVLVAFPIWRTRQMILGNLAGSLVIFSAAIALILRESIGLERLTRQCLDAGFTCWPDPSAFMRYAIYAAIGLIEVFALFTLSLKVEENIRKRNYAPEWREGRFPDITQSPRPFWLAIQSNLSAWRCLTDGFRSSIRRALNLHLR